MERVGEWGERREGFRHTSFGELAPPYELIYLKKLEYSLRKEQRNSTRTHTIWQYF